MDKILEALVGSSHPVSVKKAIVKKVVEAAEKEVTEEQCHALYGLATRLILLGEDTFQRQVGIQVLEAYARCHRAQFECFFTKEFVVGLLQQGYGSLDRKDPAVIDYVHSCLRLLISCPSVLEIFGAVQVEVLRVVCERPGPAMCARLSTMLLDFVQCIPRDKSAVLFCQQLLRTIAHFQCTSDQERELQEYVSQVTKVSTLLQTIWKAEPATLLPSLQEVFAIISSTDPYFEPSIALASLVQHIPLQMITVLIKSLTTDRNVKDASMTQALCRMIDWLSWPLAQYVDTWVIALLKGLAAVQKFTILIDVTLLKIELVFSRLWYPVVRQGALVVLSHMLLSFQHCPEAFHLVVPQIVDLVQSLKSDGLPTSKDFLLQFTELIHCMMYQFSGFPDLYENILEVIKELPKPGEKKMKQILNRSAWTSQSNSFATGLLRLSGKSETGKTGLVNLGNTCYMNSILQTLFMATDFRRHVLSQQLSGSNTLMKKLQLLFAFLAHTQRAAYAPRSFFDASRPPWFTAGSQQDCSEYLRYLLDRLHEEEKTFQILKQATSKAVPPEAGDTTPAIVSRSTDTRSHIVEAEGDRKTLVEKLFRGRLCTGIRCLQCNSISEKDEPFTDLSLAFYPPAAQELAEDSLEAERGPASACQGSVNGSDEISESSSKERQAGADGEHRVPNGPGAERCLSVPDLVNYFLAPEILDEENKYYCERCVSLQRAEKTLRVLDTPEYLILTLLRFSYDARCHVRRKILENVSIPLLMRLPSYHRTAMSGPTSSLEVDSFDSGENLAKKLKPSVKEEQELKEEVEVTSTTVESVPYVLCSVVMHSGMSSESGHYYCYCRNVSGADQGEEFKDDSLTDPGLQTCFSVVKQEEPGAQPLRDWFLFNDSRVTFTSFQSVQSVTSRFPKDTAYVLVYRKQSLTNSGGAGTNNWLRLTAEPPLQKELMDAITKDNKLFLQEQELSARTQALQAASCSFRPNGFDDNDPPGSCGPSGGGGGGGFNTISRLVF
ncbi:ubiquitin carboxyl-terminal hydrolase 38 [Scleropages formosus]|uniref:Ubiquitin specific peptidase 38 n=1 Tax=Scleropages formosus TaxID=113540 RepID=A0A8C9S0X8_SCLFO|nr:ubiquitin carboxyl-terminal hydrolase 38 [Scleropages formosus]